MLLTLQQIQNSNVVIEKKLTTPNSSSARPSTESAAVITKSVESVEAAKAQYESAVGDIKKELDGLTNNIADFFKRIEALEKRLGTYEKDTAVQKSVGDVDSASRDSSKLRKGFAWDGSFLGVQNF